MKLEELIQKRFVSTATLVERLTTYNGVPAVFSLEAPGDEQEGWGGETQYPMVTYNYDLQANEERNSAPSALPLQKITSGNPERTSLWESSVA